MPLMVTTFELTRLFGAALRTAVKPNASGVLSWPPLPVVTMNGADRRPITTPLCTVVQAVVGESMGDRRGEGGSGAAGDGRIQEHRLAGVGGNRQVRLAVAVDIAGADVGCAAQAGKGGCRNETGAGRSRRGGIEEHRDG